MIPTTPSGTRTRSTRRPLGRTHPSTTSPTGSGRPATVRSPPAIEASRARSSRSRSREVASAPARSARSTSAAFASRTRSARCSSRSAARSRDSSRAPEEARARTRPAALARRARSIIAEEGLGGTVSAYFPVFAPLHPGAAGVALAVSRGRPGRRGGPPPATPPRAAGRTAGPPMWPPPSESWRTRPLAKTAPSGPAISTASSMPKAPRTEITPAGRRDRPRSTRARRAPASTTTVPEDPTAKAIHSLRAGSRRTWGRNLVPDPGHRPGHRSQDAGSGGVGDDRLHPRPHGDLGCGQLRAHPAAAHRGARAPGDALELVIDLDHLFDQRPGIGPAGILGQQAGGVGQQHQ